jgi:hypothetical protein
VLARAEFDFDGGILRTVSDRASSSTMRIVFGIVSSSFYIPDRA